VEWRFQREISWDRRMTWSFGLRVARGLEIACRDAVGDRSDTFPVSQVDFPALRPADTSS
jgi:hypothetical protein